MRTPPADVDSFIELLRKSEILENDPLEDYLHRAQSVPRSSNSVRDFAEQMVRDGMLTPFHSEQLLEGKWKGFHLGKYRMLQLIGVGGMGHVFLCEHEVMRRLVAVKILPATTDPSSVPRFFREARAVARLDHPNVVRAFDIDQEGSLHFLVLEYVDGDSLQQIVTERGPLAIPRAINYVWQAAKGLEHAFELGLVHRDVKPGNLLLDRHGVVKLLDLGLSRFFKDVQDRITQTFDLNNVLGTADYLAPEQAVDSHDVDVRADVYALGATFYCLLTGRPPYDTGTPAQKILLHQLRQPDPVRELRADVPEEVSAIVNKMMAMAPADRYQTPIEVVQALQPWIEAPLIPPADEEVPQHCPLIRKLLDEARGELDENVEEVVHERELASAPLHNLPATTKTGTETRRRWILVTVASVIVTAAVAGTVVWYALDGGKSSGNRSGRDGPVEDPKLPLPAGALPPDKARDHLNETRTIQMFVLDTTHDYKTKKLVFLSSMTDYQHLESFTVAIKAPKGKRIFDDAQIRGLERRFEDHVIRLRGRIVPTTDNRAQIEIPFEEIDQIEIVWSPMK